MPAPRDTPTEIYDGRVLASKGTTQFSIEVTTPHVIVLTPGTPLS